MGPGMGLSNLLRTDISQHGKAGKAATECREAHGVRGACSRFGARRVARKRQQAGRTPIRFARFASGAAQPVPTPIERAVAFRPAVGAWFAGFPPGFIYMRLRASNASAPSIIP